MPIIIDNPNANDAFSSFNFDKNWLTITARQVMCTSANSDILGDIVRGLKFNGFKRAQLITDHSDDEFQHHRPGEASRVHYHIKFRKSCNIEKIKNMKLILQVIDKTQKYHIQLFGEKQPMSIGKFSQWILGDSHCNFRLITNTKNIEDNMEQLEKQKEEYEKTNIYSTGLCFFPAKTVPVSCDQLPKPSGLSSFNNDFNSLVALGDKIVESPSVPVAILAGIATLLITCFKCGSRRNRVMR